MTVLLPQPLAVTSGWQLADWLDESYTSAPAAAGTATITLDPLSDGERWQLTHMVAFCSGTSAPQMRLYLGNVSPMGLRDGTNSGSFDVADWPQGLMVPPGAQLIAQWTGCNDGDTVTLTLQANIFRRTG
jgi:hypothetical protein